MNVSERKTETLDNSRIPDELMLKAFARLDKTALGAALGLVCGAGVFFATVTLLLKGGDPIGPNLQLLGQYFIGYAVTWTGSLIGLAYGFAFGFILGWSIAVLRNFTVSLYIHFVKLRNNLGTINDLINHL
jgi:hypothetical protein